MKTSVSMQIFAKQAEEREFALQKRENEYSYNAGSTKKIVWKHSFKCVK